MHTSIAKVLTEATRKGQNGVNPKETPNSKCGIFGNIAFERQVAEIAQVQ